MESSTTHPWCPSSVQPPGVDKYELLFHTPTKWVKNSIPSAQERHNVYPTYRAARSMSDCRPVAMGRVIALTATLLRTRPPDPTGRRPNAQNKALEEPLETR